MLCFTFLNIFFKMAFYLQDILRRDGGKKHRDDPVLV